jgi:hypothetical protein
VRLIAVVFLCAALTAAPVSQAQMSGLTAQALMPSPLGVALTVGQWLIFSDNKRIYYIEVAGRGDTAEQARDNGFRLAVEQALGSLISSETEVQNGRIARDEIISYAAGYVDRFTIVSTSTVGNQTDVVMKVWVGRSALADRLLNRSEKSGELDGARASVQLQTLNQERATGDALLQQVLNDFPKRAFDIDLRPTDILRQNRSAMVEVNFKLSWNRDYLRSLWTALEATGQRTSRPASTIIVNGGGWFGGFGGAAKYDDTVKFELLANRMYAQGPTVMVSIRGPNREVLFSSCYMYQELDNMAQYNVTTQRFVEFGHGFARLNGHYTMPGRIQIPVGPSVLSRAHSVDMDIVLRKQCPNR